jgi:hypothetical protein
VSLGYNAEKTFPFSLHDLPVTRIHDLLISTFEDPDYCLLTESIYNDILGKSMGNSPMKNMQSGVNETPVNQKGTKADHKYNNEDTFLNSRDMTTEEYEKAGYHSEMSMNVLTTTIGVSTRSMTRLKNFRMEQEERLSPNSNIKHKYSDQTISSDAARKRIGGMVKRNAPKVYDKSVIRRSRRLMNPKK